MIQVYTNDYTSPHRPTHDLTTCGLDEENDISLLRSLELEHRASMIDLEETEQQYHEASSRASEEPTPPGTSDILPRDNETLFENVPPHITKPWFDSLFGSAREEIKSIRSSLSRSSIFDAHHIQGQVSQQSERLSLLMVEDQHRISQRWSATLSLSSGTSNHLQALMGEESTFTHQYTPSPGEIYSLAIKGRAESAIQSNLRSIVPAHPFSGKISALQPSFLSDPNGRLRSGPHKQEELKEGLSLGKSLPAEFKHTAPSTGIGSQPKAHLEPFYHIVLDWFWQQNLEDRSVILDTLKRDISELPQNSSNNQTIVATEHDPYNADILSYEELWATTGQPETRTIIRLIKHQINSYGDKPDGIAINLRDREMIELSEHAIKALHNRVVELDLSYNQLSGLLPSFSGLSQVRSLDLKGNRFQTIPSQVLQLCSLESLDMSGNLLRALPSNISQLVSLKFLRISGNTIRGLPLAIGDMPRLTHLDYRCNSIAFPTHKALESFMPTRYAPTPLDDNERCAQETKRLKAFLKMTFNLSPEAGRYQAFYPTISSSLVHKRGKISKEGQTTS
jgi:Leucine-rich repeat (LRR) protein